MSRNHNHNNNSNVTNNVIELTNEQKNILLSRFPINSDISLCKRLSNKVKADIYQLIPVGKQSQLWYTYLNDMNIAVIITKINGSYNLEACYASFENSMAYGTIISGVYYIKKTPTFTHKVFCADNISYYKGEYVGNLNMLNKLSIITNMFEYNEIGNIKSLYNSIRVCMPIMSNDITKIQNNINNLPYPTFGIKFINYNEINPIGSLNSKIDNLADSNKKCVFLVKANVEPDSYTLYGKDTTTYNDNRLQRIGIALIPSYQDSIRMNTLFRRIRENMSIDTIEDSDDEDDFENIEPTKYLLPNVEYKMYCSFSNICNRWIPESIASPDTELSALSKFQFRTLHNINTHNKMNSNLALKRERKFNNYNSVKNFSGINDSNNQSYRNPYKTNYRKPSTSIQNFINKE